MNAVIFWINGELAGAIGKQAVIEKFAESLDKAIAQQEMVACIGEAPIYADEEDGEVPIEILSRN